MAVAPRAGAWIETSVAILMGSLVFVAPRAGAWIETEVGAADYYAFSSHPVRVRGLKHFWMLISHTKESRTPCGCVD